MDPRIGNKHIIFYTLLIHLIKTGSGDCQLPVAKCLQVLTSAASRMVPYPELVPTR